MNIYQKLIEVRKIVPYLQKENAGGQYKYVSSSQVLSSCIDKMNEIGLLLIPQIINHKVNESIIEILDNKEHVIKRTITYFTEIDIEYTWINANEPKETIKAIWYGQGVDIAGEKGVGKALTYAEKYFLLKSFNIATDKDDPDTFQGKSDTPEYIEKTKKTTPISDNLITDAQTKRLYAISKGQNEVAKKILAEFGYQSSKDIKKEDYDKICKKIEEGVKNNEQINNNG